jgi:hypothetical protein
MKDLWLRVPVRSRSESFFDVCVVAYSLYHVRRKVVRSDESEVYVSVHPLPVDCDLPTLCQ